MPVSHIVGIDPGLVHTGCVRLLIDQKFKLIHHDHCVVDGIDVNAIGSWAHNVEPSPWIFMEKYVPRSNFGSDERMVKGEQQLRQSLPDSELLRNTGVKTIVTPQILWILGLTKFPQASHHQDLLSAARIAVLGMMKNQDLNRLLADIVMDHIDGHPWTVHPLDHSNA